MLVVYGETLKALWLQLIHDHLTRDKVSNSIVWPCTDTLFARDPSHHPRDQTIINLWALFYQVDDLSELGRVLEILEIGSPSTLNWDSPQYWQTCIKGAMTRYLAKKQAFGPPFVFHWDIIVQKCLCFSYTLKGTKGLFKYGESALMRRKWIVKVLLKMVAMATSHTLFR